MSLISQSKQMAVAEFLAEAMAATRSEDVDVVFDWLLAASPNLAAKLEAETGRTANVKLAVSTAIRAKHYWRMAGSRQPLYQRLKPAAKQLHAALR